MFMLVPSAAEPPALAVDPRRIELDRLHDEELALLGRAVGEHLPIEDLLRLEALLRRRRELELV